MKTILLPLVLTLGLAWSIVSRADDWPAWRGPEGTGVAKETKLPLHWNTNDHVRWRAALPDRGNSTPIVSGGRVFITQAVEKEGRRAVICFDRKDGRQLWQQGPIYRE